MKKFLKFIAGTAIAAGAVYAGVTAYKKYVAGVDEEMGEFEEDDIDDLDLDEDVDTEAREYVKIDITSGEELKKDDITAAVEEVAETVASVMEDVAEKVEVTAEKAEETAE